MSSSSFAARAQATGGRHKNSSAEHQGGAGIFGASGGQNMVTTREALQRSRA